MIRTAQVIELDDDRLTPMTENTVQITVVCADDRIRHEPFTNLHDAQVWAEWGHCCLARHTFHRGTPMA